MCYSANWEKGFSSDVVDFVFDEQKGLLKGSINLYIQFKASFPAAKRAIAGDIIAGDDKQCPPLQAADLLCGQIATMLAKGKPEPAYQRLVTCHEVAGTTAYSPKFEQTQTLVKILGALWTEKKVLDELIDAEEKNAEDSDKREAE